ncbi:hypothetical protein Agub_g3815, partial [Astrephomene gubernaculifera]
GGKGKGGNRGTRGGSGGVKESDKEAEEAPREDEGGDEDEVLFERLVAAVGVNVPGGAYDPDKLSERETEVALHLARRCGFRSAQAALHHLRGDFAAALACHLGAGGRQQQQQLGASDGAEATEATPAPAAAARAFSYVRGFLEGASGGGGGVSGGAARGAMFAALLGAAPALVAADAAATAQLLLAHYPGETQAAAMLERLAGHRRLQYDFLTAAVRHKQALQEAMSSSSGEAAGGSSSNTPAAAATTATTAPAAVAAAALGAWISQPSVCDAYVRLLCEYDPSAVLPFLQHHDHEYDVRHCIQLCRTAGVLDAEAYLHERLGDLETALELHLADVERRNRELEAAVCSGAIPCCHVAGAGAGAPEGVAAAAAAAAGEGAEEGGAAADGDSGDDGGGGSDGSGGCVFLDHLVWLLQLSPRLALIMQGSLGRAVTEAAERARSSSSTTTTLNNNTAASTTTTNPPTTPAE